MNKPGRRFCFTSYAPDAILSYTPDNSVRLIAYQLEVCPETGRFHVQGYLEFPKPQRPSAVKKLFGDNSMHIEHAHGSGQQCIDYATKEDSRASEDDGYFICMYGCEDVSTQGERSDIQGFVQAIKDGASDFQLVNEHTKCFVRYGRALASVRAAVAIGRDANVEPDIRVYWGPTGTGKSARAHMQLVNPFSKQAGNRWWDGYTTGQSVILDDFRDDWWSIDYMLKLLDRYPMKVCDAPSTAARR